MDAGQKRPSVFDRLGSRTTDSQPNISPAGDEPAHVSVIVSAPTTRRPSTSSESGSCSTTDEEEAHIDTAQHRASVFDRISGVIHRRVSPPKPLAILHNPAPAAGVSNQPSIKRKSPTPPHLRDKKGLMYDRHGNLRVPLKDKVKPSVESPGRTSRSPSATSSSSATRKAVNSPTDYRQYYLEYQRSKGDVVGAVDATRTRTVRSNRPPFLRQNSKDGESPSHSSRPSRGSSICSSSSQRGSGVRKSRLERSSLAGDVSPISASGSTFSDFDDSEMRKKRRLEAPSYPEPKVLEARTAKKPVVLSDLSDGEFTGDEGTGIEGAVSDLDSISDNELSEIIGESDGIDPASSGTSHGKPSVYRDIEIDWSSLITAPKVDVAPISARKRYCASNILSRIGFSSHFAGESLTKKIIDFCEKEGTSLPLPLPPSSSPDPSRCFHQIVHMKRKRNESFCSSTKRAPFCVRTFKCGI